MKSTYYFGIFGHKSTALLWRVRFTTTHSFTLDDVIEQNLTAEEFHRQSVRRPRTSSPQVERLCGRRPHAVQFRGVWVRELDGAGCVGGHRETAEETESANRSGTVRLGEFWLTHLVDTSAQFMYCNDVQFELFYFAYKTCFRCEWSHLKFRKKLWLLFNFHVYTFPSWIRLPDEAFVTLAYWTASSPSTLLIQVLISMKACEIV